ncbi:uncharacterized protein PF3D7_1120000-like [Mytilus edulis]|uniref:uncharacterized protein PF3D7_1120000-like n=1 Tax=Mytilus edulis TaxID=6550 RepID=UPI0039EF139A
MSSKISKNAHMNVEHDNKDDLEIDSIRHIDVLQMKIKIDDETHQNEKDQIHKESRTKIKSLQDDNNSLTIKTNDQADKMRQLENANTKKEREIEKMKNSVDAAKNKYERMENKLIEKIANLETQIQQTKETNNEQKEEIERLTNELSKVEYDLMKMKIDKRCEEQAVQQQIKSLETNLEKRDAEMLIKIESGIKEQFKSLLTQVKTVTENNDKTTINNTGNVQINQTNSNGALHTQRQILPMKKVAPEFTCGRKH